MQTEATVFDRTYRYYLKQIGKLRFESIAPRLGVKIEKNIFIIQLFNNEYNVSAEKITGPSGEKPAHDICVLLSKYLLLCPDEAPKNNDWVSFRDLKDSGPLMKYFTIEVEGAIASNFSGKINDIRNASKILGGYPPVLDVEYDFAIQFEALPMIPVIMLFNDKDDDFPAKCSVLFERRVEKYLDAECVAMIGWQLSFRLLKALKYQK